MGQRIVGANGKGGAAKSSWVAGTAGVLAERGERVLVIDLDPQSNQAEVAFGIDAHDEGRSLYDAAYKGDSALCRPVTVRDRIDLVPAGEWTSELGEDMVVAANALARAEGHPRITAIHRAQACGEVARVIADLSARYDKVLIDTPPAYGNALAIAGLLSAEYLVIPTRAGRMSRSGLSKLVRVYDKHQVPCVLLGLVLVGLPASAKSLIRAELEQLDGLFGGDSIPLLGVIRAAEKATYDQEEAGLLAVEYHDAARSIGRRGGNRFATNTDGLVDDYRTMVDAMLAGIATNERVAVPA